MLTPADGLEAPAVTATSRFSDLAGANSPIYIRRFVQILSSVIENSGVLTKTEKAIKHPQATLKLLQNERFRGAFLQASAFPTEHAVVDKRCLNSVMAKSNRDLQTTHPQSYIPWSCATNLLSRKIPSRGSGSNKPRRPKAPSFATQVPLLGHSKPRATTFVPPTPMFMPPGESRDGKHPPVKEIPTNTSGGSPPLILKWLFPPAHYVELAGTFTVPKWDVRFCLNWCPRHGCHWIELLEVCPGISGSHQYKFIVDGEWKCDPFSPICDDGSANHNLNNFVAVFPEPIRCHVFASQQRRLSVMSQRSLQSTYSTGSFCGSSPSSPKEVIRSNFGTYATSPPLASRASHPALHISSSRQFDEFGASDKTAVSPCVLSGRSNITGLRNSSFGRPSRIDGRNETQSFGGQGQTVCAPPQKLARSSEPVGNTEVARGSSRKCTKPLVQDPPPEAVGNLAQPASTVQKAEHLKSNNSISNSLDHAVTSSGNSVLNPDPTCSSVIRPKRSLTGRRASSLSGHSSSSLVPNNSLEASSAGCTPKSRTSSRLRRSKKILFDGTRCGSLRYPASSSLGSAASLLMSDDDDDDGLSDDASSAGSGSHISRRLTHTRELTNTMAVTGLRSTVSAALQSNLSQSPLISAGSLEAEEEILSMPSVVDSQSVQAAVRALLRPVGDEADITSSACSPNISPAEDPLAPSSGQETNSRVAIPGFQRSSSAYLPVTLTPVPTTKIGSANVTNNKHSAQVGNVPSSSFPTDAASARLGSLLKCNASAECMRRVSSLIGLQSAWPPQVTDCLHSPDVLLDLNIPMDVVRMQSHLQLQCGAAMIPHPDKKETGGADAWFVSADGSAVGVADGVGEWDTFGLNPREFAEELMQGCQRAAEYPENKSKNWSCVSQRAAHILQQGYDVTRSYGSSTALVGCLDAAGESLGIANLGDSSVIVLRRQRVPSMTLVYRSREMQHQFNCPYQLSRLPEASDYDNLLREGKGPLVRVLQNAGILPQDTPSMSQLTRVPVREGDIIILGTDGLFDNLFDSEICALVNLALSPYEALLLHDETLSTPAQAVATALAEAAFFRSQDPMTKSPFQRNARNCGAHFMGGKLDDITVVACWVTRPRTICLTPSPTLDAPVAGASSNISVEHPESQ